MIEINDEIGFIIQYQNNCRVPLKSYWAFFLQMLPFSQFSIILEQRRWSCLCISSTVKIRWKYNKKLQTISNPLIVCASCHVTSFNWSRGNSLLSCFVSIELGTRCCLNEHGLIRYSYVWSVPDWNLLIRWHAKVKVYTYSIYFFLGSSMKVVFTPFVNSLSTGCRAKVVASSSEFMPFP